MSVDWAAVEALPRAVRAAMQALHLERPAFSALDDLAPAEWDALLEWLDRQQMTLLFGHACEGKLPISVKQRIEVRLAGNRLRLAALQREYGAIAAALQAAGVSHRVLKGFTHAPPFVPSPELRPQYDLDLLVAPESLPAARRAIERLGFEALEERGQPPADHCPPLVRKTGWTWKGDYFDPEIPPVVELHFRLWDPETEGFQAEGLENVYSYACAHALRHLLRGSLKVIHVYEIARYSSIQMVDRYNVLVDGIISCFGTRWFGGPTALEDLPAGVRLWLDGYAASPLTREFRANKDELWLHFELIDDWRTRLKVARRRLAPLALPGKLEGQHDREPPGARERLARAGRYGIFVLRRLAFHASGLVRTAVEARRWYGAKRNAGSQAGVQAKTAGLP